MIEKAQARGIYRRLAAADLMQVLAHHPNAYDLLVAADVFTYIGDLAPVLAAGYATLRAGGLFAFTTELGEGSGYLLSAGGHYRHAPDYVASTAAGAGFTVRVRNAGHLRMHHGTPIPCETYVLAKP
jgi:predicted TPR repeat methyltransferase